jgi:hydrogenase maturation protease
VPADRKSILVIGLGNSYRSDDGVGEVIAGRLMEMLPEHVDVHSSIKDGLSLIHLWHEYDCVYLIDAVSSGRTPGKVYRFDAVTKPPPKNLFKNYSTHSIDILETIALAENLDSLPEKLIIYGVEGKDFSIGSGLSDEVLKSVCRVTDAIIKELDGHQKH